MKLKYHLKINLLPHSKALHLHYREWLSNILSIIFNYSRYSFSDKLWDNRIKCYICKFNNSAYASVSEPMGRDPNLGHQAILNGSRNNELQDDLTTSVHFHFIKSLKCYIYYADSWFFLHIYLYF